MAAGVSCPATPGRPRVVRGVQVRFKCIGVQQVLGPACNRMVYTAVRSHAAGWLAQAEARWLAAYRWTQPAEEQRRPW